MSCSPNLTSATYNPRTAITGFLTVALSKPFQLPFMPPVSITCSHMNNTQFCVSSGPNVGPVCVFGLKARYKSWLIWYIGGLGYDALNPMAHYR